MAVDVIIAGAGVIGSSIAWRLAQHRLQVLLLDAGRFGGEASSAAAGMLAPGGEIGQPSAANELALEGLRLYPAYVAELEEESGLHIDFQRLGAIEVALSRQEWADLQARAERQAGFGIPSGVLTATEIRKHLPLARQDIAGALFYPEDAVVDPRDLLAALRQACLARGVEVREGTRVTGISPRRDSVRVETAAGVLEAAAAVLAAGAWSSDIPVEGVTLSRAYPVRGHLVGYRLEPHSLGPVLRWGHTYVLQRTGGFTIAGSSSEQVGFDRTIDPKALLDIHSRASTIIPALAECQPVESWLGFRPAVDSGAPVLGRAPDTALWLAYGHYRNGILMAPSTAHRIAHELISSPGTGRSAPRDRP